jgi:hypothetical protein
MLAGAVGGAVIVRQEIDELAIDFRAVANSIFCEKGVRLYTNRSESVRQSRQSANTSGLPVPGIEKSLPPISGAPFLIGLCPWSSP